MPDINLFGLGFKGKSLAVTAQERTNCYLEPQKDKDKGNLAIYGWPGKTLFASVGASPSLHMRAIGNYLYTAHFNTLYQVNNGGVYTNIGTLLTSNGSVVMSDNGTQLMVVDGQYGYIYNTSTGVFAQITDPDFPANPTYVTYIDTYFVVTVADSNRFYISDSNDGTGWTALDYASAEANPDKNVAVFAINSQLLLFGERSTEFWGNTGGLDFPFARIQGSSNQFGLASRHSLTPYDGSVAGIFRNADGALIAGKIVQYQPLRLSTPEIEDEWSGYSQTGDATGLSYVISGHPIFQLNFPTEGVSWAFDGLSGAWNKLKSYQKTRDVADRGCYFLGKRLVSDYSNGNIYQLDDGSFTENGNPYDMEIVGKAISKNGKKLVVDHIELEMETGVGLSSGQGSDPKIMMQVSKDKGRSFGTESWRSIGKVGETKKRVKWGRLGASQNFTMKFRITDPVKRVITGAVINVRQGI